MSTLHPCLVALLILGLLCAVCAARRGAHRGESNLAKAEKP
jgi:hypothetical protein